MIMVIISDASIKLFLFFFLSATNKILMLECVKISIEQFKILFQLTQIVHGKEKERKKQHKVNNYVVLNTKLLTYKHVRMLMLMASSSETYRVTWPAPLRHIG